jgi:hypothetical protein
MKSNNSFSPEFFLPNQNIINQNNNDNNLEKQIEQNNALIKDNISFNTENNSTTFHQSNTNKNKENIEQTELNDLNIAFLLPKDLQENLGVGEEGFNENELIIKDDESNSLQINNINQFNEYNFDINNNDIINKGNDINFNQGNNNEYLNILNCNNLQGNINFINNSMNINDSNNTFNYSNNLFENNNNNFSNIGFIDFINPQNYFNNQEKELQQMNYNNQNITRGNNFNNNQLYFTNINNNYNNNNNYMNQINQFNYNQIQQQSNDIPFSDYQNKFNNNSELSQNEAKKTKKKMIDEYTIEMFGRRGWICELCNNFNYETRKKCNRCHINKKPKKINSYLLSEKNKNINHKNDWYCTNCGNFNYFFRVVCNRCQRKKND